MICALSWSGGKDATLALDRALRQGLDVRYLFNTHEAITGRVRFHGVRRQLVVAQAASLGLELLQAETHPHDFDLVFLGLLDRLRGLGVEAVVFGNIHLADVRDWYEQRVHSFGLHHLEPLWGSPPAAVAREFVDRGFRARVVSVNTALAPDDWLGRELNHALLDEIEREPAVDPAGERGEYHTFTYDGPLFRWPVSFIEAGVFEREGHRVLDLVPQVGE